MDIPIYIYIHISLTKPYEWTDVHPARTGRIGQHPIPLDRAQRCAAMPSSSQSRSEDASVPVKTWRVVFQKQMAGKIIKLTRIFFRHA